MLEDGRREPILRGRTQDAVGAENAIARADERIALALSDGSVRRWVKDALVAARGRDPVDAAQDAAFVAELLASRADALLAVIAAR